MTSIIGQISDKIKQIAIEADEEELEKWLKELLEMLKEEELGTIVIRQRGFVDYEGNVRRYYILEYKREV